MVEIEIAAVDSAGRLLGSPRVTSVMVDSGADMTVLDEKLASVMGFDLAACPEMPLHAFDGREVPVRWRYLLIGLCGMWINAPVAFQAAPQPQVLGRASIFDHLALTFLQRDSRLLAVAA